MSKFVKLTAIAAVLVGMSGAAYADPTETKGGLKVKTEDGRFEFNVNGRIHLDAYMPMEDHQAGATSSNTANSAAGQSGVEFRRTRLSLSGKAYGWDYKFECDFTSAGQACYRDLFIATNVGPGKVTIGHFKPYRGMEELTSSNELTMMERPFTSASGVFNNRQFATGLGYLIGGDNHTIGLYAQNQYSHNFATRNEGWVAGGRVTMAPMMSDTGTLHLGLSASMEDAAAISPATVASAANYGGRRGASFTLGTAGSANATSDNDVRHIGLEFAGAFGPLFFQAEAMQLTLNDGILLNGIAQDQDLIAGYVMTSFLVTGESKPYKKGTGVFGSPKPKNASGAVELTARYDVAEKKDKAVADRNDDAASITLGVNWYVNPNVRFMLNYVRGMADQSGVGGDANFVDEPENLMVRTQFNF